MMGDRGEMENLSAGHKAAPKCRKSSQPDSLRHFGHDAAAGFVAKVEQGGKLQQLINDKVGVAEGCFVCFSL